MNTKHYQTLRMIEATYVPCTDEHGSRVKIFEKPRDNSDRMMSKTFGYDHEYNGVQEQAQALLERNGFNIKAISWWRDSYVFLCDNYAEEFIQVADIKQ